MSYTDKQREHIMFTFHAFCKTVICNEAINSYRDMQRKQKHETSLDYLQEFQLEPSTADEYFAITDRPTVFTVCEHTVIVASEHLARALLKLSDKRREIVILYFYCGYNDVSIGELYGCCRSTANYQRLTALKQLRKEMEVSRHAE
jgi:RNA polymerase sigma factor (sigma-70 family)